MWLRSLVCRWPIDAFNLMGEGHHQIDFDSSSPYISLLVDHVSSFGAVLTATSRSSKMLGKYPA